MKRQWRLLLQLTLIATLLAAALPAAAAPAGSESNSESYVVYQYERAIRSFSSEQQAVAYAKGFTYAHVETASARGWLWDNFPRYKVYQGGLSTRDEEFRTLQEAAAYASSLQFAQIRDLQQPGWLKATYPKYRLYQGDESQKDWLFATLEEAKQAAKRYKNVHIIELSSNQWVWDDLSPEQKNNRRAGPPVYRVEGSGLPQQSAPKFAFLLDAIRAAAKMPDKSGRVIHIKSGKEVFTNAPPLTVKQNGSAVRTFYGIGNAVQYAGTLSNAVVYEGAAVWWTNLPYYIVSGNKGFIFRHHSYQEAIASARQAKKEEAYVLTADGRKIWSPVDQTDKLLFLGWNGVAQASAIQSQLANTSGLDIDAPSWFELSAADGTLADYSDPALSQAMQKQGIKVMPLVHNQFDAKMTSAFLRDSKARERFITRLINRLEHLGADGLNLDFELLAGDDRSFFTVFVQELTKAAHQKNMKVSIDLPRGDKSWDVYTAFDHKQLGKTVDTVIMMGYDQHWEGGDTIGSVGELAWVEEGVRQFLNYGIPKEKIMLGIPFYAREWKLDQSGRLLGSRAVLMKELPQLIAGAGAQGVFDPAAGQTKYSYAKNGYTYVFWAETPATIQARIGIAKKLELAGVAFWRLGFEEHALWEELVSLK